VRPLLASAAALMIGAGFVMSGCSDKAKPIRIGLSLPLTDPAVLPMIRGADLALRQINEAGGVNGRPLELVRRDDFGEPDSAVQVAADLYASDVVAVIGSAYSGATITAAPVYNGGRCYYGQALSALGYRLRLRLSALSTSPAPGSPTSNLLPLASSLWPGL